MLLRDAQEEAKVVYNARRNTSENGANLFELHLSEVASILEEILGAKKLEWKYTVDQRERIVGLTLLVGLELANELEVDCLHAIKSVFLEESP